MVVLVNKYSASAAEIVAGALQDHDRGWILGETTFGKGLVQTVYPLNENAGLALTTAHYYTPSGRLIQRDYSNISFLDYYYNRKGEGLGRQFLRYPVSFARISSHFSTARYHPVLKRKMPHYGVDFAAPTGTPVKAAADGVVSIAGWHGGNGRFVKMRHDAQYESGYAHLSRIASGVRPGARVKQGQVIGYVGSTGLATGPHLHFAMYKGGKYVDPLQASLPRTVPLTASALAGFKAQLRRVEQVYAERGLPPFGSTRIATAAATTRGKK